MTPGTKALIAEAREALKPLAGYQLNVPWSLVRRLADALERAEGTRQEHAGDTPVV